MTDELKSLINKSEYKTSGEFDSIMLVPNGIYNGSYGENGFDNMLVLGEIHGTWYVVANSQVDIFQIYKTEGMFSVDVPSDYGVPRFWYNGYKIKINYDGISSCTGELVKEADLC